MNRRGFVQMVSSGLLGCPETLECVADAAPRTVRVGAVQMTAALANVDVNLVKAEHLVRQAFKRGAKWVILPEFFTSAIAFHPDMTKAIEPLHGRAAELLCRLAREGNAYVGGSFLAWRNGNAYNSFVLALPNGNTLRHDKDYPSYWEACYYLGGSDEGVLRTSDGNVGVALCFEFVRSRTARRLRGKVGMVIGGSCWWGVDDSVPADDPIRKWLLNLLIETPGRFARMLGVPVVHASHAGRFVGRLWPGKPDPFPSSYLGETQIVSGKGEILARLSQRDGEGIITADVAFGEVHERRLGIPDRFWIPDMPAEEHRMWETQLRTGREYYLANTLPELRMRFGVAAANKK